MLAARVDHFADVLGMSTSFELLLPERVTDAPLLYLLHGLSDDCTAWLRRSSIERYAEVHGIAVVMPQAARSFYTDEAHGLPYWSYISEELPAVVARSFHVAQDPRRTYVAGLSMGGYGALKLALRHPERFRGAASLSGAVDVAGMAALAAIPPSALDAIESEGFTPDTIAAAARTLKVQATQLFRYLGQPEGAEIRPSDGPEARAMLAQVVGELRRRRAMMTTVWGDASPTETGDDLFALVASADVAQVPPLLLSCGTEDNLYADNRRFEAACRDRGLDLTAEFPPGDHTWEYWDLHIRRVLDWLPRD